MRLVRLAGFALWMLAALAASSWAQEDSPLRYPRCAATGESLPQRCRTLNVALLAALQRDSGDIRSYSIRAFMVGMDAEGRAFPFDDKITNFSIGAREVPFFDEVVKIELEIAGSSRLHCTGVALGWDAVLTAGHCACAPAQLYRVKFAKPFSGLDRAEFYEERRLARAPITFPGFDCSQSLRSQPGRDLALLFLERFPENGQAAPAVEPAPREDLITPPAATLFTAESLARRGELTSLMVLGYGRRESGEFPHALVATFVPVSDFFCLRTRRDPSGCAPFREFALSALAGGTNTGADACNGDSGGPVYFIGETRFPDGVRELHRQLIGITSRGLRGVPQPFFDSCGGGGVYTAVGHPDVLKWLAVHGVPLDLGPSARRFAEKAFPCGGAGCR